MHITIAEPEFRPITLILEDRDDYDQIIQILANVADNKVNHGVHIIKAAQTMLASLHKIGQMNNHA